MQGTYLRFSKVMVWSKEVAIPPRRYKHGRRFGFVKFRKVEDEGVLAMKLDNIFIKAAERNKQEEQRGSEEENRLSGYACTYANVMKGRIWDGQRKRSIRERKEFEEKNNIGWCGKDKLSSCFE